MSNYHKIPVIELERLLELRGLPTDGSKIQKIGRLKKSDEEEEVALKAASQNTAGYHNGSSEYQVGDYVNAAASSTTNSSVDGANGAMKNEEKTRLSTTTKDGSNADGSSRRNKKKGTKKPPMGGLVEPGVKQDPTRRKAPASTDPNAVVNASNFHALCSLLEAKSSETTDPATANKTTSKTQIPSGLYVTETAPPSKHTTLTERAAGYKAKKAQAEKEAARKAEKAKKKAFKALSGLAPTKAAVGNVSNVTMTVVMLTILLGFAMIVAYCTDENVEAAIKSLGEMMGLARLGEMVGLTGKDVEMGFRSMLKMMNLEDMGDTISLRTIEMVVRHPMQAVLEAIWGGRTCRVPRGEGVISRAAQLCAVARKKMGF